MRQSSIVTIRAADEGAVREPSAKAGDVSRFHREGAPSFAVVLNECITLTLSRKTGLDRLS